MRRWVNKAFCLLTALILILSSCSIKGEADTETESETPKETVSFTEKEPIASEPENNDTESETEPESEVEEAPDFNSFEGLESGAVFILDGVEIAGSRKYDGVDWIPAKGIAEAVCDEVLYNEGTPESFTINRDYYYMPKILGSLYINHEKSEKTPFYCEGELMLPLDSVMESLDGEKLFDEENNCYYVTDICKSADVPTGKKLSVLMYHAVSDDCWGIEELFVKPAEMEKQLKYLSEHGYTTITFEDLSNLESIKKPVMLTFDDGYSDNYTELFPLLKKYNFKATVFFISGKLGKKHYLTAEMIKEMSESGLVSIQSHTVTHPYLSDLGGEKLRSELRDSRLQIARLTGKIPFVLCYPTGKYNNETREMASEYYQFGIKMNGGRYNTSTNPFLVPRSYVSRYTSLSAFASLL